MALIKSQLGLLEDDIVYRLAMLATNILEPLKAQYPNIVIVSGFRETNTGIGQHETGEAVDLQIRNQTPEIIYEVAKWIEANLNFDQLILNFTRLGNRQPWIHVSFSPTTLRQQVLTKDFSDVFHAGLYIVEELSGEEAAAARRAQQELDLLMVDELEKIQDRRNRLADSKTKIQDAVIVEDSGIVYGTGGAGGGDNNPERAALVRCVHNALGLHPAPTTDINELVRRTFETTKRVAWLLRGEGCGLLLGPVGGEHTITWQGYLFRASRVCYPDGQIYKVLSSVGTQNPGPQWVDNGVVETSMYVPALDPGSDINTNWLACPIPEPITETPTGNVDISTTES